jgi:lipopolysaccharide/colanic/teichoic acid biosynthesis glycosyltransferase
MPVSDICIMVRPAVTKFLVRFQVLMVASMKMVVFWVVVPIITIMVETASTSEMLVNFYQTTCYNNPEDSHLYIGSLVLDGAYECP